MKRVSGPTASPSMAPSKKAAQPGVKFVLRTLRSATVADVRRAPRDQTLTELYVALCDAPLTAMTGKVEMHVR